MNNKCLSFYSFCLFTYLLYLSICLFTRVLSFCLFISSLLSGHNYTDLHMETVSFYSSASIRVTRVFVSLLCCCAVHVGPVNLLFDFHLVPFSILVQILKFDYFLSVYNFGRNTFQCQLRQQHFTV